MDIEQELAELLERAKNAENKTKPEIRSLISEIITQFLFEAADSDFDSFVNKVWSILSRMALAGKSADEAIDAVGKEMGETVSQAVINIQNKLGE